MNTRSKIPQSVINIGKHLPETLLASLFYRFPSRGLKIVGVTGTDGKTTTVSMIFHILTQNGLPAAMVSTVSAKYLNRQIDTGLHVTSPSPWFLQKFLRTLINKKIKYVVLETTSHGLDQLRFWGIKFQVGVMTNITHEHLDYHQTLDRYTKAKLKLLKASSNVVLNKDDASFKNVLKYFPHSGSPVITFGIEKESDFQAEKLQMNFKGTDFILKNKHNIFKVHLEIFGKHNVYNSLSALAVASQLGIDLEKAVRAIGSFKGVEGRLERVENNLGLEIFVDFAHTPNALKNTLGTLRNLTDKKNRLIAVFGSAGKRDKDKRPVMGEVAAEFADLIILTADDPRDETVEEISRQIARGCEKKGKREIKSKNDLINDLENGYLLIDDRREAIKYALTKLARRGDTVAFCGKGHEKSLAVGDKELPWSDQMIIKEILERMEDK